MSVQTKTFTQAYDSLKALIVGKTSLTNWNVGGVARTITEAIAQAVTELYSFGVDMLREGFAGTASDAWLDRKAAEVNLTRGAAIKTEGNVRFGRQLARAVNVTIPAGTSVGTQKDQAGVQRVYSTTAEVVLLAGTTSIVAPVQAAEAGSAYNVAAGSISVIKTFISGVESVTNAADWIATTGSDAEKNWALRARIRAAWDELPWGSTAAAVRSWALGVSGVVSAFVDDAQPRGDGTADVYVVDADGPAGVALVASVQAVIDLRRPVTADIRARAPVSCPVDITMAVTPWPNQDLVAMDTEISRRLSVYFGDIVDETLDIAPLSVGKDVVWQRIVQIVMAIPGVYSVDLTEPAATVIIDPHQWPDIGTVLITFGAPTNE